MDLYELLQIERTATLAEIRAAYRRLVRTFHPDAGGSEQQFNELKMATDVLSDPERRARYDATGETNEDGDRTQAEVTSIVEHLLDAILSGEAPEFTNIIDTMSQKCSEAIEAITKQMNGCEKKRRKVAKIQGKMTRKTSGPGDMIAALLDRRLKAAEAEIEQAKHKVKLLKMAKEILANYSFVPDEAPPQNGTFTPFTFVMR